MYLFKKAAQLQEFLSSRRERSRPVGFVPTMGALHEGHLSLIHLSRSNDAVTVCSIFVNPTQFNQIIDLEKYPRTPAKDIRMLVKVGCDALFMPTVDEVYPEGKQIGRNFDFGNLDKTMEGHFRPGHFAGVVQVVDRLLEIVRPDRLYMGQKDFQQAAIVRNMLHQVNSPVELVIAPTVREAGGLAMSSRNERLDPALMQTATILYQSLMNAKELMDFYNPQEIKEKVLDKLSVPGIRFEYFEIVDGHTLQPVRSFDDAEFIVACVAAWAGDVRLIDNMILKR